MIVIWFYLANDYNPTQKNKQTKKKKPQQKTTTKSKQKTKQNYLQSSSNLQ